MLFNQWGEEFDRENPADVPCCCVVGTLRYVAGGDPSDSLVTPEVYQAIVRLDHATQRERKALGSGAPVDLVEWSDHYADREQVCDPFGDTELSEHRDGNRGYVATTLRKLAKAMKAGRA